MFGTATTQERLAAAFQPRKSYEQLNHFTVASRLRVLLKDLPAGHELMPVTRYDLALALSEVGTVPENTEAGDILYPNLQTDPYDGLSNVELLSWMLFIQNGSARRCGLDKEGCIRKLDMIFEVLRARGEHRWALIAATMVVRLAPRGSTKRRQAAQIVREYVYWPDRKIPVKIRLLALAAPCRPPRLRLATDHLKG